MTTKARRLWNTVLMSGVLFAVLGLVPNTAAAAWFNCDITAVWEDNTAQQLFVSCSNDVQGRNWFSIQTSQFSTQAENRFVSMASAALLSNRIFRVNYSSSGCPGGIWQPGQCYLVTAWSLYNPQ